MSERAAQRFDRLLHLGVAANDSEPERAQKRTLTLIVLVAVPVVMVWSIFYGILGEPVAAAIPAAYSALSTAGLVVFSRTKNIRPFRATQLTMWLLLPFGLQWTLGGFANGSAVGMWALAGPLLAHVVGAHRWPPLAAFMGLAVFSGFIDGRLADGAPDLSRAAVATMFVLNFLAVAFVASVSLRFFANERERSRLALEAEREKSEQLLLNILPKEIAGRLKAGESVIADRVDEVSILFADLVGSTPMSERLTPDELVGVLGGIFSAFDDLADELGVEKIKTIGDAYMVAGGLPEPRPNHLAAVAEMALGMRRELSRHSIAGFGPLQMRYGIHTGSVVAGVIGKRKFSYDLWGDAVNTAARMESTGEPGEIQVSEDVYRRLRKHYEFEPHGPIEVKGKGLMTTYYLKGRKESGLEAPNSDAPEHVPYRPLSPEAPREDD